MQLPFPALLLLTDPDADVPTIVAPMDAARRDDADALLQPWGIKSASVPAAPLPAGKDGEVTVILLVFDAAGSQAAIEAAAKAKELGAFFTLVPSGMDMAATLKAHAAPLPAYVQPEDVVDDVAKRVVMDVRREDEVANFGLVPGGINMPLHRLAKALAGAPVGKDKETIDAFVASELPRFTICRTQRRATVAAQLLLLLRTAATTTVIKGGHNAMAQHLGPTGPLKPYPSYMPGETVPEPLAFTASDAPSVCASGKCTFIPM